MLSCGAHVRLDGNAPPGSYLIFGLRLTRSHRVLHSFLLFFFICNFVEGKRRHRRPLVRYRAAVPRYAHAARYYSARSPGEAVPPPAAHYGFKQGQVTTPVEMNQLGMAQQRQPGLGALSLPLPSPVAHDTATANSVVADPGASERAAFAQAMSGLWDMGEYQSYQNESRRGEGEEELGFDSEPVTAEQPPPLPPSPPLPAKVRYM